MEADHPRFGDALAALDAGDVSALAALLDAHPELAHARSTGVEAPYDGYFHGATLLHHVAGNPIRGTLPDGIVDIARLLLEAGADAEAGCGGGPSQPDTGGGTVLGLVVTGAQAHIRGVTEPLIDLLLEHGARLQRDQGMFGTLYHTVEHRGQREVARMLFERGVEADLPTASGLGFPELVRSFFREDGSLEPDADRIWRRGGSGSRAPGTREQILGDALVAASANGWPDVVAELLNRGAPIDAVRPWGPFPVTPLHAAAWAGWPDVVSLLLERGADPELREPTHDGTPLGWAQHADRADCVAVLQAVADDADPVAAFREAVEGEDVPRVRRLLEAHESVRSAIDAPMFSFAAPALVLASSRQNAELMTTLLDAGADVDATSDWDAGGFRALHHQVSGSRPPGPELARLLLDRGAALDLHSAAGLGRLDVLAAMLDEDPGRINERGPDGTAPLHWARDPETAAWLVERGADVDQRCLDHNSTPAMWAIGQRPDVVRYLLSQGATPDLFMAAVLNDVALAERVLADDPDAIASQTREGPFSHPPEGGDIYIWQLDFVDMPHEVARLRGNDAVYHYLVAKSPPGIQLAQAAREGATARMEAILREVPDTIARLSDQRHWDLMCQSPPALAVAVAHGGDVDVRNRDGVTPMHEAAWRGEVVKVRWLVEHGADPRVRDTTHASTPLGWADFNGQTDVVEYLKAHTDPDIVDATVLGLTDEVLAMLEEDPGLARGFPGASPLRAAAYKGNRALVEALLAAGADPAEPNPESGMDAVDIARQRGHTDLVPLLENPRRAEPGSRRKEPT